MLIVCVIARYEVCAKEVLSVEAVTVKSVAQGRRTPPARRSLRTFLGSSLRALLPAEKGAVRMNVSGELMIISRSNACLYSNRLSP